MEAVRRHLLREKGEVIVSDDGLGKECVDKPIMQAWLVMTAYNHQPPACLAALLLQGIRTLCNAIQRRLSRNVPEGKIAILATAVGSLDSARLIFAS
ncbi:hypothetical protein HaLaN_19596, partial [Haematococcus lacustris]